MSLISGSNSLTPATVGALDLSAAIVENGLMVETARFELEIFCEYDRFLVGVIALEQREQDFCCCSCRIAIRLTVLSQGDMSDVLTGHNTEIKSGKDTRTIGLEHEVCKARRSGSSHTRMVVLTSAFGKRPGRGRAQRA